MDVLPNTGREIKIPFRAPRGSHALEGYITVNCNSDGFLSEREEKKKGICHVLTNLPGRRGYNLGTEEPRKQTYTGEHVN